MLIVLCFISCFLVLTSCVNKDKILDPYDTIYVANLDSSYVNEGFTCTGLYYDPREDLFYLGNIGKLRQNDSTTIKSSIEIVAGSLECKVESISLYEYYPSMEDVQGITKDNKNTLWFCSCRENAIYNITTMGGGNFGYKNRVSIRNML